MSTPSDRLSYRVFILFGLAVMAAMTVSEAVTELSAIAREFHPTNPALIGLVMSMPSLVVAIGALAAGYLVDRLGDRPILLAGAITIVVGDVFVMAAPNLHLLLAARLVDGLGYVLTAVSSITMLMRISTGKQRTMALVLWSTSVPVSFILPFLTAGLAAALGTWRAAFGAHALVTAALLVLAAITLPAAAGTASAAPSRTSGLTAVLRSPWPYLLGLSFAANACLQSGITASLAPYLARRYGISEFTVQYWSIAAMLANVAGSLLVGRQLNRGVRPQVLGYAGILLTVFTGCLMFGVPLGAMGSIIAFCVFTFGSGLLVGMWALVPRCAPSPDSMGATSGVVTQLTLIGVLFGAPLAFASEAARESTPMLALIVVATLICIAGGLPVWRRSGLARTAPEPARSAAS